MPFATSFSACVSGPQTALSLLTSVLLTLAWSANGTLLVCCFCFVFHIWLKHILTQIHPLRLEERLKEVLKRALALEVQGELRMNSPSM